MNIEEKSSEMLAESYLKKAGLDESQIEQLREIGYFDAPASKSRHLCCPGGLARHSMNVADYMTELKPFSCNRSSFRLGRSNYRVGMLHDIVKCKCYKRNKTGDGYDYVNPPYPGHGVCSALLCAELGIELDVDERLAIIWHMGAFGLNNDELKEYDAACRQFPREVILTHAADHLASKRESEVAV